MNDEENFSAQQSPQEEDARLSRTDADPRRPEGAQGTPGQGPQAPVSLRPSGERRPRPLRRSADYRRIYRDGAKAPSRWFVLFGRKLVSGEPSAYGITASRKVGNAVARNRCKRRLRVLAARWMPETGVEIVINARRGLDQAAWPELEGDFRQCLRRLLSRLGSHFSG
jgi:ribonuclease P protein component